MPNPIYLDYNATTPVAPEVVEAMLPFLREDFGNPSSAHWAGRRAREALERARGQVAGLIGARPEEILFTSGGTESNNMVLLGVADGPAGHVVTSAVEHPAVLEPCRALAARGWRVTLLPVDAAGRVSPEEAADALEADTRLVSIMHANNEVGTIQPVAEIAAAARRAGVAMHTDAAQSVGKIPVDVQALGVDYLTIAGHKLSAPKGVGALYVRSGRPLPRLMHGAGQERGRRPGTENLLEIVGLGCACALAQGRLEEAMAHTRGMRDLLLAGLRRIAPGLQCNGDPEQGLPNTLSVSFPGVDAAALLAAVGDRLAASAGAACHARDVTVSSVLVAMRIPAERARGTVRFSVGWPTTPYEIDTAVDMLARELGRQARGDGSAV